MGRGEGSSGAIFLRALLAGNVLFFLDKPQLLVFGPQAQRSFTADHLYSQLLISRNIIL